MGDRGRSLLSVADLAGRLGVRLGHDREQRVGLPPPRQDGTDDDNGNEPDQEAVFDERGPAAAALEGG